MSGPTICAHCGSEIVGGRCPSEPNPSDTDRLDWLERKGFSTATLGRDPIYGVHSWLDRKAGKWGWTAHYVSSELKSAREAIDAAMEAERNA